METTKFPVSKHISRTFELLREFMNDSRATDTIEQLNNISFGIDISPDWMSTMNGHIIASTVVKLLLRMVQRIHIVSQKGLLQKPEWARIIETWMEEAHNQPKPVNLVFTDRSDYLLIIGNLSSKQNVPSVYVQSDGWEAYVGTICPKVSAREAKQNPIGACLAGALGVAELFKNAVGNIFNDTQARYKLHESFTLSAYSYEHDGQTINPKLPDKLDLGRIHLVGGGAIGNAFIYTLSCLDMLSCHLIVILIPTPLILVT